MEHTNLFFFENKDALETKYPSGKVDDAEPGVAYARPDDDEEDGTVYYNRMVTNYSITIHSKDRSGATVASDYVIQTPKVLDGESVKMNVVANSIDGYIPVKASEKVEFTSANTEYTVLYLAATSYTVTVHHVYSGQTIAPDSEIFIDNIFEDDVVDVTIEPVYVSGYVADEVILTVSSDTVYTLEYREDICFVDLGLPSGTLWACANLGAQRPEDLGDMYAWGETTTKANFTQQNYKYYDSTSGEYTKYTYDTDQKVELDLGDDAAHFALGEDYHMPTIMQIFELKDNTTLGDGGDGYMTFISKINGETIVFPYIGECTGQGTSNLTLFWTSERVAYEDTEPMCCERFCEGSFELTPTNRYLGLPIRPVKGSIPDQGQEDDPLLNL